MNSVFDEYRKEYIKTNCPISVNFRELVPKLNNKERYTHLIHSYPAKLLCNIPYYFLSNTEEFCPANGIVLDPFCGTGTVLLEAALSGRKAWGADANPLAVLISRVKTTYISKEVLLKELSTVLNRAERSRDACQADGMIDGWFSESTITQLYRLQLSIEKIEDEKRKDFFLLCLSNLIKKVSYADPTIAVPVHLNPQRFAEGSERRKTASFRLETLKAIDVYDKYESICRLNIDRISTLKGVERKNWAEIVSIDARHLTRHITKDAVIPNDTVDLILTSPPYAGAQKYIRASRLNLYWLGIKDAAEIRNINDKNIGREDYHKKVYEKEYKTGIDAADKVLDELYLRGKRERACIVGTYLNEMKLALDESYRVLKPGGHMIIVIGNNTVCGLSFNTQDYLTSYLQSIGMHLEFKLIDDIKSYGLMTKRNKTANTITSEWILVLKK